MRTLNILRRYTNLSHRRTLINFTSAIRSTTERIIDYLDNLKNYEKSGVPRSSKNEKIDAVVHIAGTKGKGSKAAFISNILRAQGYSVGCYTSPRIQTIRERISLGRVGNPLSVETLNILFQSIRETLDQSIEMENGCLSHFEIFTAMAFTLFAQEKEDIAVIGFSTPLTLQFAFCPDDISFSVYLNLCPRSSRSTNVPGLGGAHDAANIICSSELAVSVITTIGEEHLAAFGGFLESSIGKVWYHQTWFIELLDVILHLLGAQQLQNAVTAKHSALVIKTYLLGRSQFLTLKETEALGLPGATILLDGAHTKDSAKTLADTVRMTSLWPD
ncbi:LOW QUALITY PROTEIN: hypothetical protein RJ641_033755 [Dillenia turbinata]|uniref:Mur ligase central domain-containing protein n=1 Tax=Dillenia turbinata TaxID=194707 RepID=A0AAN8VME6_9MAGN